MPGPRGAPGPRGGGGWCLVPGRGLVLGGVPGGDPPTATAVGGTHPTGMHSCCSHLIPIPYPEIVSLSTSEASIIMN